MSKKTLYKLTVSFSIALFLTGIIYWGYAQLNLQEKSTAIDLYNLVPMECEAILETNNINTLYQTIRSSQFSKDYESLKVSEILRFLTADLDQLSKHQAHGLSTEMSQLLISFHQPGNIHDQVVYGRFSENDKTFINELMQSNTSPQFPPKTIKYKGEKITIYPLGKNFLACYFQPGFFAISFEERLIEKVIDAHKFNHSVSTDSLFMSIRKRKKRSEPLALYLKSDQIEMGHSDNEKSVQQITLAHWSEFDIRMNEECIYMVGRSLDTDTSHSFGNMLKEYQPIHRINGDNLPQHVQMVYQVPFANSLPIAKYKHQSNIGYNIDTKAERDSICAKGNEVLLEFLKQHFRQEMDVIVFNHKNSPSTSKELLRIPLNDDIGEKEAERDLRRTATTTRVATYWIKRETFPVFKFNKSNFLHPYYVTHPTEDEYYMTFYRNVLLVAKAPETLKDYIESASENGMYDEIPSMYNNKPLYKYCLNDLAEQANFTLVADMGEIMSRTPLSDEQYILPSFFFRHKDFFKNFMFSTQIIYTNGQMNTNLILTYQGDSTRIKIDPVIF